MAECLFHDLRFDANGQEKPEFVLNRDGYRDAMVVVGGRNFGCGSSRENAVWALYDYGIRAVISPGGSRRDGEVIAAADEHDTAMVFTGTRHFRH